MASINMEFGYPKEVEQAKREHWPVLLVVGTMEYHSSHVPFGCDALTAMGLVREIAKRVDCLVLPPIWYGVASYAVGGPEKSTIHVDCDTLEDYMYAILKSLFKAGFTRNIHIFTYHQCEEDLPQALAIKKAAKKLTFEYMEETQGLGWWGNNDNADFYKNLKQEDNPWNFIRVHNGAPLHLRNSPDCGGDHAGKWECAMLEWAYPGSVKLDRLPESDDWFAQDANEMDVERADRFSQVVINDFLKMIGREDLC